jgi:hypothetical protein
MSGRVNNMKWIGTLFVVLFALSLPAYAQTAKVIALSPADAAEAKDLYAQRDAINKKIADLQTKVTTKYLMEEKPGPGNSFIAYSTWCTNPSGQMIACVPTPAEKRARAEQEEKEKKMHHLELKEGWFSFEFSDDFKFIVPLTYKPTPSTTCYANPAWLSNNLVAN